MTDTPEQSPDNSPQEQPLLSWQRQPEEPVLWFARFEYYRKCGPTRSIMEAYKHYVATKPLKTGEEPKQRRTVKEIESAPATWSEQAAKWNWKKRAEAYDLYLLQQDNEAEETARMEARLRRRRLLDKLAEKIEARLDVLDAETITTRTLVDALKLYTEGMRTEYDDLPANRNKTELTGNNGAPLSIEVVYGDNGVLALPEAGSGPDSQEEQE